MHVSPSFRMSRNLHLLRVGNFWLPDCSDMKGGNEMQSPPSAVPSLSPGIYPGIPSADYHRLPYLGSSTIKRFRDNPATCRDDINSTRPMILGEASHALSLEGREVFNRAFVVAPEFLPPSTFTGKVYALTSEYKGRVAAFEAANVGKITLTADEGKAVEWLDHNLRVHPMGSTFMETGAEELTVIWDDPGTGLRCKARIDWYREGVPSDWKTTQKVGNPKFLIADRNYDIQGAHYSMGLIENKQDVKAFSFLFGETVEPYRIRTGILHPDSLEWAMTETTRLIGLYAQCLERDVWPNYAIPEHIHSLDQLQPFDLLEEWEIYRGRK